MNNGSGINDLCSLKLKSEKINHLLFICVFSFYKPQMSKVQERPLDLLNQITSILDLERIKWFAVE